jgi:hypothetical protein
MYQPWPGLYNMAGRKETGPRFPWDSQSSLLRICGVRLGFDAGRIEPGGCFHQLFPGSDCVFWIGRLFPAIIIAAPLWTKGAAWADKVAVVLSGHMRFRYRGLG